MILGNKILSLSILTYFVFGIVSLFQLGTFLPPMPIKPWLVLVMASIVILKSVKNYRFSSYLLLSIVVSYCMIQTTFWELILGYQFQQKWYPLFYVIGLNIFFISYTIFNLYIFQKVNQLKVFRWLIPIAIVFALFGFVIYAEQLTIDLILFFLLLIYVLISYQLKEPKTFKPIELSIQILGFIALLNTMDLVALSTNYF